MLPFGPFNAELRVSGSPCESVCFAELDKHLANKAVDDAIAAICCFARFIAIRFFGFRIIDLVRLEI
jgi:hypothetical protein